MKISDVKKTFNSVLTTANSETTHWIRKKLSHVNRKIKLPSFSLRHSPPSLSLEHETSSATDCQTCRKQLWPLISGEYFVPSNSPESVVAVSVLASKELAERLAILRPKGLCIVGKTETENTGVVKVIKNIITNPNIRFLILAGKDSKGHCSGKTLVCLWQNGVNEKMAVIGSPGSRPILRNVTREEVEDFRKQIKIVDLIGCEDVVEIVQRINKISQNSAPLSTSKEASNEKAYSMFSIVPLIKATENSKTEMDKAGYFLVIPQPEKGTIMVEHYSYDNKLLRQIEGEDAESIYRIIIENQWVTQLSHAAYIGKELATAELSNKLGFKYTQT